MRGCERFNGGNVSFRVICPLYASYVCNVRHSKSNASHYESNAPHLYHNDAPFKDYLIKDVFTLYYFFKHRGQIIENWANTMNGTSIWCQSIQCSPAWTSPTILDQLSIMTGGSFCCASLSLKQFYTPIAALLFDHHAQEKA